MLVAAAVGLLAGLLLGAALWRRRSGVAADDNSHHAVDSRLEALQRVEAVAEERERIYADLHDDIGAKLLTLVYQASSPEQADLARSILQDLRDVVSRSRGQPCSLLELLGQLHNEAERRAAAVGITLDWQQLEEIDDCELDEAQNMHLVRIVREGISNVIQHAEASRLRVRLRRFDDELSIELADDGSGLSTVARQGRGLENMRQRAAEVEGDINWSPSTAGGTRVVLRVPLTR